MTAIRSGSGLTSFVGFFVLIGVLLLPCGAATPAGESGPIALTGALIHTLTEEGTFVGNLVVRDGKIEAIGADLPIPDGIEVIDLTGYTIVPGLIDCRSVLWLTKAAIRESSSRGALSILDGVDPWLSDWREVSRQGVTAVSVQPNDRGSLGGHGSVLRVAPARSVSDLVILDEASVQSSLGIVGRSSRDRFSQFERLRKALEAVIDGRDPGSLGGSAPTTGTNRSPRGGPPQRGDFRRGGRRPQRSSAPSQPDRTKELLQEVVDGDQPLRLEVHHPDALGWAISLATELDIDLVLEGISDPGRALSRLASSGIPVVVGPIWELGAIPDHRKKRKDGWFTRVTSSGSRWALGTFGSEGRSSRFLRVQAAAAVAEGAKPEDVLCALTKSAAEILGVGDLLGTLAEGKQADLAVFAGNPLDPATSTRLVMSRGQIVHESESTPGPATPPTPVDFPSDLPTAYGIHSERVLIEGNFRPATMMVREGRITSLGASPGENEIRIIDVGSAPVVPGLVAAHSYLGQLESVTDDTESDASQFRSIDVADLTTPETKGMVRGGFLHIGFAPSSGNTSAGVMSTLHLEATDPVGNATSCGKFVLTDSARSRDRYPSSLGGQINLLEEIFSGRTSETRLHLPMNAAALLVADRKKNVGAVLSGDRPAVFAAESRAEIGAALDLIERFKLRGALLGPVKVIDFLDRIRSLDVAIIARPVAPEDYDSYPANLAKAAARGIRVVFAGDSPAKIRTTAALAVEAGMTEEKALLGLTGTAADVLGMAAGTARLQVGGPASFVIWTDSPLNLGARPTSIVVEGVIVDEKKMKP